jgi:hypothetical protein
VEIREVWNHLSNDELELYLAELGVGNVEEKHKREYSFLDH